MKFFLRIAVIFLLVSIGANYLIQNTAIDFGWTDYWVRHPKPSGLFLLFFLALFPRLTLLFSSIPFGGLLWWAGWFFAPRFLIACLATIQYWQTNKTLVVVAWLVAWGGESGEKYFIQKRVKRSSSRHK